MKTEEVNISSSIEELKAEHPDDFRAGFLHGVRGVTQCTHVYEFKSADKEKVIAYAKAAAAWHEGNKEGTKLRNVVLREGLNPELIGSYMESCEAILMLYEEMLEEAKNEGRTVAGVLRWFRANKRIKDLADHTQTLLLELSEPNARG